MHSVYSDGDASIDAMARSATDKGLTQVTITDHMPLPFDTRYAMVRAKVEAYRRDIRQAQTAYKGRLNIKSGIEFEYIPRYREWIHDLWKMGWDHCIVSVHWLFDDDIVGMVNGTLREFDAWYRGLVMATMKVIKARGMKMEINTAGINHPVSAPYPSPWIVHEAAAMDIPMVLGSDSHNSGALGQHFDSIDEWYDGFGSSEMAP